MDLAMLVLASVVATPASTPGNPMREERHDPAADTGVGIGV